MFFSKREERKLATATDPCYNSPRERFSLQAAESPAIPGRSRLGWSSQVGRGYLGGTLGQSGTRSAVTACRPTEANWPLRSTVPYWEQSPEPESDVGLT